MSLSLSLSAPRSDLNGVAPAVTAPAIPGHSVGLPHPVYDTGKAYPFINSFSSPDGWWVSACSRGGYFGPSLELRLSATGHRDLLTCFVRRSYRAVV